MKKNLPSAAEQLRRINRDLRAVRDCNRVMKLANDVPSIWNDVCRIMCDVAGYRMAWIGTVSPDGVKTIKPVAWAGIEEGYLKETELIRANHKRAGDLAGKVVRTGKTALVRNFSTLAPSSPWCAAALSRGYRSGIAIPLPDSTGTIVSVFTLYSQRVNDFSPAGVSLLEEFGRTFAFGISIMQARTENASRYNAREWQATFDAMTDMVSIQSVDFKLLRVNKAYASFVGIKAADLIGKKCFEIIHGTGEPPASCPHLQTINSGVLATVELFEPRFGACLEAYTAPLFDESGKLTGTIHVAKNITERKTSETRVAQLASFPDLNPNPVIELDKAGNILFVNASALKSFPDLRTKGITHPFLAGWDRVVRELPFKSGALTEREIPVGDFWYTQTIIYLKDSGEVFRVYAYNTTDRKRVEEALLETSDYLNNLFNYANAPIMVWDPQLRVTRFNHAFERLTGQKADRIIGQRLDILCPKASRKTSLTHIRKTAKPGHRWETLEIPVQHKDGSIRTVLWNSATLYADDGKTPVATIAQGQDITSRKQAEEALSLSEEILRRSQEIAHLGSWELDLVNNRLSWSDEVYRIFGVSPRHFAANYEAFLETVHPEDRELVAASYSRSLNEGQDTYDIEHRIIRKPTNEVRYLHEKCAHIRDENGKIIRSIGMVHDITERRLAENILKQRTAELEEVNKELESFSYSVSHDLREPLRAIDGFACMLHEYYRERLDDEGRRMLETILQGTARMGQLITDLLSFSRISRQYMSTAVVDMGKLAVSVSDELKAAAIGRNLDIRIGELPPASGDMTMIRQVLTNLLSNAIKFTRPREQALIEIGSSSIGLEHIYYVKDNGVGFNPQYTGKLFNIFQRLHSQQQFEGTGVGLAIVYSIIRRHGGRVWAESILNKGATFYFTLPAAVSEGRSLLTT